MPKYKVGVQYSLIGHYVIEADDMHEAYMKAMNDCGCVVSNGIHSSLPDDEVNWDFPVHTDEKVLYVKKINRKIK